jgi:ADP-heptose:LPS heptosyltransferase
MKTSPLTESIQHRPWTSLKPPKKILVIRFHSFGDVVITLPYVQALQAILPLTQFHILTQKEYSSIACNMTLFVKVFTIGGERDPKRQWFQAFRILPPLMRHKYDIVIDLQRNPLSRMIRRALHPKSYCEFDRFSLHTAGERTKITIDRLGFAQLPIALPKLELRDNTLGLDKLFSAKYSSPKKLIVLNPAGNFATKNWPLEYYVQFAQTWLNAIDRNVQFTVIGVDSLRVKAEYLNNRLGDNFVSLVGGITQAEAFNILQKADLVLSEDSGLMHMAWVSHIPVIALFGSTKSVWSKPIGRYSVCLDSSDLDCGECAQPSCRFGDIHCLTRHTPDSVIKIAQELMRTRKTE